MANLLTDEGKDYLLSSGNWITGNFDAILVDSSDFTFVANTTINRASIPSIARVSTQAISGKTLTSGTLRASNVVFTSVAGDQFEEVYIVANTGVEANDVIIARLDGLSLIPNGNNITVNWSGSGIISF